MKSIWPDTALAVLLCLTVASSGRKRQVNTGHLDAALHHYHALHVDEIKHTPSADHIHHISFSALDVEFHMMLQWDRHILARDFAAYSVDSEGNRHQYDIDPHTFLRGHLEGEERSTLVTAHLSHSGVLSAVIATPNDTYHIEPSHLYIKEPHPFHMVAYARSHVKDRFNSTMFDYHVPPILHPTLSKHPGNSDTVIPATASRRLRRQSEGERRTVQRNTCNMALVADFTAFTMFGSMDSTMSQLVLLLSSIDKQIYRPTDWIVGVDSIVGGLGHSAALILVHESPSNDPMNYNTNNLNARAGDILGLMRFGPWTRYCLAHLFTDRNFPSGLLGLANIASPVQGQTGGICSQTFQDFSFNPPASIIYNTGLSTYNNNGQPMILSEMIRVVAHELGHNWGSHHDPNTQECDRSYLMNEYAQDGSALSHMVFSNCSRRSIGVVYSNKGTCFNSPSSVCGDLQVSEGEECDEGEEGGQCCTAETCMLRENAQCSDINSLCCRNCTAASTSVRCRSSPRISPRCTAGTNCDGVDFTCPATPEPAANGTECSNGICLLVPGSEPMTECVPLCQTMGLTMCTCSGEDECMVCCDTGSECSPLSEPPVLLSDGSECQAGVCRAGECSPATQDQITRVWTIIVSLNASAFRQFIRENIVGCILIFSIPIWCLGSCLLHWLVDHPRQRKLAGVLDKVDIGQVFRINGKTSGKKPSKWKPLPMEGEPLLKEEEEEGGVEEMFVEPEDDLPPPEYRTVST